MSRVFEYREAELQEELESIPREARVAFALGCCDRLISLCISHGTKVNHQLIREIRNTMVQVSKEVILGQAAEVETATRIGKWLDFLETQPADSGDAIEDVVSGLVYTLRCHQTGAVSECAWVARRAYECADRIALSERGGEITSASERVILRHPLIQAELGAQKATLTALQDAHGSNQLPTMLRQLQSILSR